MAFRPRSAAMQIALQRIRPHLAATAAFSALVNLLFVVPTIYMLQVYDRVVPTRGYQTLALLTLVLLFALATLSLLDRIRTRLLIRASLDLEASLAPAVLRAALGRPEVPEARQALRDLDAVRGLLTGPAMLSLFDAPWMPIYVLVCFLVHPTIGLTALAAVIILPLIFWLNERSTRTRHDQAQQAAAGSYFRQEHLLASADALRAMGMRAAMIQRQLRARKTMMLDQASANFESGAYFTLAKFFRLAMQSLALGLGGWLAIRGSISGGAIFAASFLIARSLQPVEQLIGAARSLALGHGQYRSLDALLAAAQETAAPTVLPRPEGRIELAGLTVRGVGRDEVVIDNISLAIGMGEVVAIIGPSGAGKSTLMRTIVGAQRIAHGTVRFDGASIEDWEPERLARHIGYLPQDSVLFDGTVAENIARFTHELTGEQSDAQVVAAAQAVRADELIKRLPGGFDYPLGPAGKGLSAGQAQRVALARALFGNPSILVLDEPNSHLDVDGDAALVDAIMKAKQQRVTVLIVSHKTGVLPVVDKILYMRNGRAELFGPRDQVLATLVPPNAGRALAGNDVA